MKKLITYSLIFFLLQGCKFDKSLDYLLLPPGFKAIASDNHSHFILLNEEFWGDRLAQRTMGMRICDKIFNEKDYCEVYYFASRADIPEKFPIINRFNPIGLFEKKYGHIKLKTLSSDQIELQKEGRVVFYKYYNKNR